jgi:hypothetical protein
MHHISERVVVHKSIDIDRCSRMKYSATVTSSRRKCRKAHFQASSNERRVIMSASLSKDLQAKHNVSPRRGGWR